MAISKHGGRPPLNIPSMAEAAQAVEDKVRMEKERKDAGSTSQYWEKYAGDLAKHVQALQEGLANAEVIQDSHGESGG